MSRLRSRARLATLGFLLLALPLSAVAQAPARVFRIGILWSTSAPVPHLQQAFLQGMRDLGYVEGRHFLIENRSAPQDPSALDDVAAELARLRVDIIVTMSMRVIQAAQRATRTIPIVMAVSGDAVEFGHVASLARPGGNVTGLSAHGPELHAKELQLLTEAVPGIRRVGLLWNETAPTNARVLPRMRQTAGALGVQLQSLAVQGPEDLKRAVDAALKERAEAVMIVEDAIFFTHRARLIELTEAARVPTIFVWKEYVEGGALMSYGPNLADLFRRSAVYVDKILKGAKPGDLPVEQPIKFDLAINLKTARTLGLTIPRSLLLRADQIVE